MELMNGNEIAQSIKERLYQIEKRENIRIIYACGSGSRAWGFASPDSDYDVRFVFVRPVQDYLRVDNLPCSSLATVRVTFLRFFITSSISLCRRSVRL